MRPRKLIALAVGTLLLLAACGSTNPGDPGGPDGPPGGNPFDGRLIARGTGYMHTMNLSTNGEWIEQIKLATGYDVPALHLADNELYVANLNMAEPMFIDVYDLSTFGTKRSFTWPNTLDLHRVHRFAVAPGGRYLASVLSGFGDPFLEILDTQTNEFVYSGLEDVVHSNLVWTKDLELLFTMEFGAQATEEVFAGVVAVPLEEFQERGDTLELKVLEVFNQADWGLGGVYDLALSADETQLAYVRNGDIWVKDLTTTASAKQLTTGPTPIAGPAFSPDSSLIVFVGVRPYGLNDTLVLPNDGTGPYVVNANDRSVTQAYVLDERNLVDVVMVWLP
jgi:hypothetical protein